ncbi:hypothetical protein TNCV_3598071 [Trichonephila clavipes]|nr:hypothetical protein TNCV_3598071 [Trichonephila clavipes]
MGAVLTQLTEQGEVEEVVEKEEVEKRYCTTEKECASIVFAIKRLHYYLDGNSFLVMTDHNPLVCRDEIGVIHLEANHFWIFTILRNAGKGQFDRDMLTPMVKHVGMGEKG